MKPINNVIEVLSDELVTIRHDVSLDRAYELMKQHNIRHLPVMDDDHKVVGIISDRDLQRAMKSNIIKGGSVRWESCEFDSTHTVSDYMSWPVRSFDITTNLRKVVRTLIADRISSSLITRKGSPVGIVTTTDLLSLLARYLDQESESILSIENLMSDAAMLGQAAQSLSDFGI